MSEEESFVILGSSPTESMDNYSIIQKLSSKNESEKANSSAQQSKEPPNSVMEKNMNPGNSYYSTHYSLGSKEYMFLSDDGCRSDTHAAKKNGLSSDQCSMKSSKDVQITMRGESPPIVFHIPGSPPESPLPPLSDIKNKSLASSFLLGEIDGDELQGNILAAFPSLCGPNADPEDLLKLQKFMSDYMTLKNSAMKSNSSMRQYFTIMQKWQTDIKAYKDEQEKQIKECKEQVAKVRNENMELQAELNTKVEQIQITEKAMRKENEDLVKLISEKSSIIENMRAQIEKLEHNQNSSFEYIKRTGDDKDLEHEYIRVSDHKTIVKDLERKLSEAIAEKLEFEDLKKVYRDELDCLKVNLTAAEEILKKDRADISFLKSQDSEKCALFEQYEKEKDQMKQEINLLRTQLEVYRKDFEMERTARQNLAGEKEQLLTDLKLLQRRNQQLIEEASARLEQESKEKDTTETSSNHPWRFSPRRRTKLSAASQQEEQEYTRGNFVCPLCSNSFKCLDTLQTHVQDCLDKA